MVIVLIAFMVWVVDTLGDVRRQQRDLLDTLRRVEAKLGMETGERVLKCALIFLLGGQMACHHSNSQSPANPPQNGLVAGIRVAGPYRIPANAGDVASFQAAVPAVDTGGHCETLPSVPMAQPGQRALLYAFGARTARRRNVMVVVDSLGHPVRYSDIRGDLRGPKDSSISETNPLGPRTSIALNLIGQSGMLSNTGGGLTSPVLRVQGPSILDAENLGTPSRMIARVLRECQ